MRSKNIISLTLALLVLGRAARAQEPDAGEIDTPIAHDMDVPDNSADLSTDVDRWVLHDILQEGFAQTRPHEGPRGLGEDANLTLRASSWQERLQAARRLARLRGEPEQHHRLRDARLAFDIPLADHPLVDVYIDYFTGRGRLFFGKWLSRARRYVPMMQQVLAAKGVPKDLVYLAMIESGFSAKAYSTAAAAGYWQFIGSTGKLYGLSTDSWIDERRDFIRATEAAATYLSQLHQQMGDWHLAWASYNAGEGRIRRALAKYDTHNFWSLIENPHSLAKETMHYVPKIIAAAMVAKDAERYGFTDIEPMAPLVYDEVEVKDATSLLAIAKAAHLTLQTLRELNPALLHDVTPPGRAMRLRVPAGQGLQVAALLQSMAPSQRLTYRRHKVRRGDTLSAISRLYHADMQAIKDFNKMLTTRLRPGQELIVPAVPPLPAVRLVHRVVAASTGLGAKPRTRHVVAAGETLWSIARRYGVTVERIRGVTKKRSTYLSVGEILEIF